MVRWTLYHHLVNRYSDTVGGFRPDWLNTEDQHLRPPVSVIKNAACYCLTEKRQAPGVKVPSQAHPVAEDSPIFFCS